MAILQQFDGNAIGRAHESHMPVARRPVDGVASVLQPLARFVDIVDTVGEMAEIAPAGVAFRRTLGGQL